MGKFTGLGTYLSALAKSTQKVNVKATTRRTASGKTTTVKQHTATRKKSKPRMRQIVLDLSNIGLSKRESAIAQRIVKPGGILRSSKPKVTDDPDTGIAAYVWRNVVFTLSDDPKHQHMPVTDIFDLPGEYKSPQYLEAEEFGDALVEKIVQAVPKSQWAGVQRWAGLF